MGLLTQDEIARKAQKQRNAVQAKNTLKKQVSIVPEEKKTPATPAIVIESPVCTIEIAEVKNSLENLSRPKLLVVLDLLRLEYTSTEKTKELVNRIVKNRTAEDIINIVNLI